VRVGLYLRVSTEEQAREGFSVAAQERALRAFCDSQGWLVAGVFADEGHSGKDLRRPALTRLLAERATLDMVLVWRLDRLSRRQAHTLHLIEDVLGPAGVGIRSATEAFDTTTAAGKAMLGMLAVFAQLERESIIERTKLGLRERRRQGKWSGAAPWGFRYGPDGRLDPDPEAAPWVEILFRRAATERPAALAAWLAAAGAPTPRTGGRWWPSTVRLILKSRVYVPAIVDEATFSAVQRAPAPRSPSYLLAGLGVCAHCGGHLRGKRQRWPNGNSRRYYICQRRGPGCQFGWQAADRVDSAVLDAVGVLTLGPAPPLLRRPARSAGERRVARLLRAVEEGWLQGPEVAARLEQLRREQAALEAELRAAPKGDALTNALVLDFPTLARFAGDAARQAMLRAIVREVAVGRGAALTLAFHGQGHDATLASPCETSPGPSSTPSSAASSPRARSAASRRGCSPSTSSSSSPRATGPPPPSG